MLLHRVSQQRELAEKLGYDNLPYLCQERKLYVKNISKVEVYISLKYDIFAPHQLTYPYPHYFLKNEIFPISTLKNASFPPFLHLFSFI